MEILKYARAALNKAGQFLVDGQEYHEHLSPAEIYENATYQRLRHQSDEFVKKHFEALKQERQEMGTAKFIFNEELRMKLIAARRTMSERGLFLETRVKTI